MPQRLKRWESPRKQGRNDKGRGGSARARQLRKQQQMLRKKLKEQDSAEDNKESKTQKNSKKSKGGKGIKSLPSFFVVYLHLWRRFQNHAMRAGKPPLGDEFCCRGAISVY